jgi:hypothetical protein
METAENSYWREYGTAEPNDSLRLGKGGQHCEEAEQNWEV